MTDDARDRLKEQRHRVVKPGGVQCSIAEALVDIQIPKMSARNVKVLDKARADGMRDIKLLVCPEDQSGAARIQWRLENQPELAIETPTPQSTRINEQRSSAMGSTKRKEPRTPTFKTAKLVAANCWTFVDGIVFDQSDSGARLSCPTPNYVSDEFRLVVPTDNSMRPCKVVWRLHDILGVMFTGPALEAPAIRF